MWRNNDNDKDNISDDDSMTIVTLLTDKDGNSDGNYQNTDNHNANSPNDNYGENDKCNKFYILSNPVKRFDDKYEIQGKCRR